jgi:hypothetical protein
LRSTEAEGVCTVLRWTMLLFIGSGCRCRWDTGAASVTCSEDAGGTLGTTATGELMVGRMRAARRKNAFELAPPLILLAATIPTQ